MGIAADSEGKVYVTGSTVSPNFPVTPDAFNHVYNNSVLAFVAKLSTNGSNLIYSTFLGGSINDGGRDIAVDDSGNAYVTGVTLSADFPTVNAFQPDFGSTAFVGDAFVS